MRRTLHLTLGLLLLASLSGPAIAGQCSGDSVSLRYMPSLLGKKYSRIRTPHFFPCDTMEVRQGDTSYIYSGAQLAWNAASTKKRLIHVKGTLIIEGWEEEPVTIAGTLEEFAFGHKAGPGQWEGFLVEAEGELRLNWARLYNAPSAIVSYSEKVSLKKVHVKGVQGIIGPHTNMIIENREADIESMDFKNMDSQQDALMVVPDSIPVKQDSVIAPESKSHLLSWSLLGTGAIAAGGLVWYLVAGPEKNPTPGEPNPFSKMPDLPPDGPR